MSMRKNTRIHGEINQLHQLNYKVEIRNKEQTELLVTFCGPKDTPYCDGFFTVTVTLPPDYPFKSPSIGFITKMYHPNIDEHSGTICLDVLNQVWSPMFDLKNVFEVFIPQLLQYPNPADPLNADAASLFMNDKTGYDTKVRDYVRRFGSEIKMTQKKEEEPSMDSEDLDL